MGAWRAGSHPATASSRGGGPAAVGLVVAWSLLAPAVCGAQAAQAQGEVPPQVFSLRGEELLRARQRIRAGDPLLKPAFEALLRDAARALEAGPFSVTHKTRLLAPSGDPHDYLSLSPYWWPDPTRPDGLPYIRRDGETNPESKRDMDQPRLAKLGETVETLALAYFFTGEEAYARRAAFLLRVWFLDPETRMNPHLRFAQLVMGRNEERGSGIIDGRPFITIIDAIGLIRGSPSWTEEDQRGMEEWFGAYLRWLQTSPNGEHELAARNNHGSWFDAQRAALALFTGQRALAREILEGVKMRRIDTQIAPDGRQPYELVRTRSLHYSGFNLEALGRLAEMARHVDVNLWGYRSPTGGSLRAALDYVAPYADPRRKWPGQQIREEPPDLMLMNLRRARVALGDPKYAEYLRHIPPEVARTHRSALLYPDRPDEGRGASR